MSMFDFGDGTKVPIVGWSVWGTEETGDLVMRQYDADDEGFAREYAEHINDAGGTAHVHPVIDIVTEDLSGPRQDSERAALKAAGEL